MRTKSLRVLLAGEGGEIARALRDAGHEVDVGGDAVTALNAATRRAAPSVSFNAASASGFVTSSQND